MNNTTIPIGHTKQDIKAREKLIKDFYAEWIVEHPDKKVWNKDLKFEKILILKYGDVKLTLGLQRTTQEYVQYCITVPSGPEINKATTEE